MTYSLTYEDKGRVLLVKVSGRYENVEEFIGKMKRENEAFKARGVTRILFDDRDLETDMDTLDAVTFADAVLQDGHHTHGFRYACLPPESGRHFYEALETVCQNRSINYRLFNSENDALDWLLS